MFASILQPGLTVPYEEPTLTFALALKSNPYRDANGKYTTKDKAFYQTEVAIAKLSGLQSALSGMLKEDIDAYLKSDAGKALVAEAANALYKQKKHFEAEGLTPMSQDKLLEDYVPSKAANQAVADKLKSSLAAKKAWEKIYKDKATKGVTEELPAMLDAIAAGNDKGGKATAKMQQKMEFWKKNFMAGGGTQEEFDSLVEKAHNKQLSPPTSIVIDLAAKASEPATATGTAWSNQGSLEKNKALAEQIAFEVNSLKAKGHTDSSPELQYAMSQWEAVLTVAGGNPEMDVGMIYVKAKKKALLAETGLESEEPPTWKPAKDLQDALKQNDELGTAYYTSALTHGKTDPKSVAIYDQWQKSKDYIKAADPSKDIPSLSSAQKTKAQGQITQAKAEAEKFTAQQVAKKEKAIENLKKAVYGSVMNGDGTPLEVLNEASLTTFKKAAEELGVPKSTITKAINDAHAQAKINKAQEESIKSILKDPKATAQWFDDNDTSFKVVTKGNHTFDTHQETQFGLLTQDEKSAISNYTGSGYTTQNKTVAGTASEAAKDKSAATIDKAMKKMTLGADVRLRRNMAQRWFWESFGINDFSTMDEATAKSVVGKTYTEKAFSSTTKDLNFTGAFSSEASKSGAIELQIRAKKDIRGFDVKALTHHAHESEVILDKGVTYIVRKVTPLQHSNFKYRVEVDAIGHKG